MDDPVVRVRLLVGAGVRITPVTPPMVVRLLDDDGSVRAQIGEAPPSLLPPLDTETAPPIVTPPIVVRLLLDDDGAVRAQIREAPPALPPPLDPETERRLDAFSAKHWDAVRRPAPPPRVKTEAERRLESFNDEHWDEWRARTTATPRPPLSTHGGNEVWRRDAHAPRDAECTFAPRVPRGRCVLVSRNRARCRLRLRRCARSGARRALRRGRLRWSSSGRRSTRAAVIGRRTRRGRGRTSPSPTWCGEWREPGSKWTSELLD